MNAKEVEANRDCEKTIQNENNFPNFAAPPSYDEVIGTQQSLINGRQQEGGYVRQQPDHCTKPKVIFMAVFTIRPLVGLYPENLICPFCQDRITTRVEYVVTAKTHFSAMICCALCWPCGWFPYLMKECHDAHHFCPKCRAFIGVHSP